MIIAVSNQKGGTGKTTTSLNLGAALAHFHKKKVLLIDLEPQGSLTLFTGLLPEALEDHLGTVLFDASRFDEAVQEFYTPRLKLLPAHAMLVKANGSSDSDEVLARMGSVFREASRRFDYVIIDCPPTLGRLTDEALCVADGLIIPLQCEYMALRGVQLMLETVDRIQQSCNEALKVLGVLPTMYDARTLHAKEVLDEIHAALQGRAPVFSTVIPRTVRLPESAVSMSPIFDYAPNNPAAIAYKSLAREVLRHG